MGGELGVQNRDLLTGVLGRVVEMQVRRMERGGPRRTAHGGCIPTGPAMSAVKQPTQTSSRTHSSHVRVDALRHPGVSVAHLSGRNRCVLAEFGTEGGIGASQRVERDARRDRRPPFLHEHLTRPFDRRVEHTRPDAAALSWSVPKSPREDEVVRLAPARCELVLSE